jgi:hypothetical protein
MQNASEGQYASEGQCVCPKSSQNTSRFRAWRSVRQGGFARDTIVQAPLLHSVHSVQFPSPALSSRTLLLDRHLDRLCDPFFCDSSPLPRGLGSALRVVPVHEHLDRQDGVQGRSSEKAPEDQWVVDLLLGREQSCETTKQGVEDGKCREVAGGLITEVRNDLRRFGDKGQRQSRGLQEGDCDPSVRNTAAGWKEGKSLTGAQGAECF